MIDERPFVLIDDARPEVSSGECGLLFTEPVDIVSCNRVEDVPHVLAQIDDARATGHHVAGYMAYELGYALEPKLQTLLPASQDAPLIWMGVFPAPSIISAEQIHTWEAQPHSLGDMQTPLDQSLYCEQIERVLEHIRNGDVYQINHTFAQHFTFSGSPLSLYAKLRKRQRAPHGALLFDGHRHIVSLSPELFFETENAIVRARPMKGTAPRAANPDEDNARKSWLSTDEKSRAENLMIVDLLRNDLARLSQVGSVKVTDLFSVETYPTLHQMTSNIEARLRPDTTFSQIVQALFPCGSVTGAPKIKAMEIIHTLEDKPRGVYTGAIGYMTPSGKATFNVAIRTLQIDQGQGTLGIGSGIVYDSDPGAEWQECHLKARFLTADEAPFSILETLLWKPDTGFTLLDRHIKRMRDSAAYFLYPFDTARIEAELETCVSDAPTAPLRVRVLLDTNGDVRCTAEPLVEIGTHGVLLYALSPEPLDTDTPFVHHKTTNRAFYDDVRAHLHKELGCDEVLFTNLKGELCDGSFTTLFVERNATLFTPPRHSGALNGTLRQDLIEAGRAQESVLFPNDLTQSDAVWLGNSVRGLMRAKPVGVT